MLNSDLNLTLRACLTGASTALRYSNIQANQSIYKNVGVIVGKASKKHLELNKSSIELIIHKPSSVEKYVRSSNRASHSLRKRRNNILMACRLVEQVTVFRISTQKFSSDSIEYRELNAQILNMISKDR